MKETPGEITKVTIETTCPYCKDKNVFMCRSLVHYFEVECGNRKCREHFRVTITRR